MRVFGNMSFPLIGTTEPEMLENVRAWGYEDVMGMVNFCYSPVGGRPCGLCRPCEQKMEGGMSFLLPPSSRVRYRAKKALGDPEGVPFRLAKRLHAVVRPAK